MYQPKFTDFEAFAQRGNLIPVYREILADVETPVSVLKNCSTETMSICWKASKAGKNGDAIHLSARTQGWCLKSVDRK